MVMFMVMSPILEIILNSIRFTHVWVTLFLVFPLSVATLDLLSCGTPAASGKAWEWKKNLT